jgi:hypothetical protein
MKVITNREIEYSNACGCSAIEGDYSNAKGDKKSKPAKTGEGKEKLKNVFNKVNDSGLLGSLASLFGKGQGQGQGSTIETNYTLPPPPPTGMTTTTKILIGVGVVSVLGIGYYLFTKKK